MADLGNLFFSLGLKTDEIDKAWNKALAKYGKEAKINLEFDKKAFQEQKNALSVAHKEQMNALALKKKAEMDSIALKEKEALMSAKIQTQEARTQAVRDRGANAIKNTNSALATQNRLMQNLNTMAANYISIFMAGRVVGQLFTITGEFQAQRVALKAILQDLEGADALFNRIKGLAVKSPFQFQDLVTYTKQLSAFSVPMGELYDTTKMLADVSAGLGVGMDRLVLAYGQIRAASVLRGQEVRQLTEAGIPVIEELRKKFEELGEVGITTSDVFDKISARLVPFEMIKEMFVEMTSEGGKFNNMQQVLADELKGKISNLKDAYQIMFDEIGTRGYGVLKGTVDIGYTLINNYEAVGKIIATLIATYGVYHASLIATAIANGTLAASNNVLVTTFFATRNAVIALNAALASNPFTALALAATTVIGTMWALRDSTTEAEKAQRRLNDTLKEVEDRQKNISNDVSGLIDTIARETSSNYERVKSWDELIKKYDYFSKYSIDQLINMSREEREALKSTFLQQENLLDITEQYQKKIKEVAALQEKVFALKGDKDWWMTIFSGASGKMARNYGEQLFYVQQEANGLKKTLEDIARLTQEAAFQAKPSAQRFDILSAKMRDLQRQKQITEEQLPEGKAKDNMLKSINKQIDDTKTALSKFREEDTRKNKEYWEEIKSNAESVIEGFDTKLLKKMREGDFKDIKPELVDAYKKAVKEIAEADRMLILYDDKKLDRQETEAEKRLRKLREGGIKLAELQENMELDLSRAKIDAMQEGWEKEMSEQEYQHNKRLEQIGDFKVRLLKAQSEAGGSGTQLTAQNENLVSGLTSSENAAYANNQKKLYNNLLDKYADFNRKRDKIEQEHLDEVIRLNSLRTTTNNEEINNALAQSRKIYLANLKEISDAETNEMMQHSSLLLRIFSDSSSMSAKRLKETIRLTKQLINYASGVSKIMPEGIKPEDAKKLVGNVKQIEALMNQLDELENRRDALTNYPLSGFVKGFTKLKESSDLAKDALATTDDAAKNLLETQSEIAKAEGVQSLYNGLSELGNIIMSAADAMDKLAEASGNAKLRDFADQFKSAASVLQSAGQGAASGGWIGAIIGAATSMITQTIDAFAIAKAEVYEFEQNQIDFLNTYKNLLLTIKEEDYATIFGVRYLSMASDAAKNATKSIREYKDLLNKRTAPTLEKDYIAQGAAMFFGSAQGSIKKQTAESKLAFEAFKKGYTDIQRMAIKTKDQSGWANFFGKQDEVKTLFDLAPEIWGGNINGEFNLTAARAFLDTNTQITDEQRKQIENLIKQKELYDENINIIREDLENTFGHLGDALTDSIVQALTTGADAFDVFEQAGAQAIENLGEKLLYEIFFAKKFEKLQKDLEATYTDENNKTPEDIANAQAGILDRFYGTIGKDMEDAQNWAETWRKRASESGFDIWQPDNANNLGAGIQGVTEQTANLLGSYMNAIRADVAANREDFKGIVPVIGNINDLMGNSLAELQMINSNTRNTAINTREVADILKAATMQGGATKLNTRVVV